MKKSEIGFWYYAKVYTLLALAGVGGILASPFYFPYYKWDQYRVQRMWGSIGA